MKSKEFIVESFHDILVMRNIENISGSSLFTISKSMISYQKGKTPLELVELVIFRKTLNNKLTFEIYTKNDMEWNENMKNNHPIIWKFNFTRKLFYKKFDLGITDKKNAKKLSEYLFERGLKIEYL